MRTTRLIYAVLAATALLAIPAFAGGGLGEITPVTIPDGQSPRTTIDNICGRIYSDPSDKQVCVAESSEYLYEPQTCNAGNGQVCIAARSEIVQTALAKVKQPTSTQTARTATVPTQLTPIPPRTKPSAGELGIAPEFGDQHAPEQPAPLVLSQTEQETAPVEEKPKPSHRPQPAPADEMGVVEATPAPAQPAEPAPSQSETAKNKPAVAGPTSEGGATFRGHLPPADSGQETDTPPAVVVDEGGEKAQPESSSEPLGANVSSSDFLSTARGFVTDWWWAFLFGIAAILITLFGLRRKRGKSGMKPLPISKTAESKDKKDGGGSENGGGRKWQFSFGFFLFIPFVIWKRVEAVVTTAYRFIAGLRLRRGESERQEPVLDQTRPHVEDDASFIGPQLPDPPDFDSSNGKEARTASASDDSGAGSAKAIHYRSADQSHPVKKEIVLGVKTPRTFHIYGDPHKGKTITLEVRVEEKGRYLEELEWLLRDFPDLRESLFPEEDTGKVKGQRSVHHCKVLSDPKINTDVLVLPYTVEPNDFQLRRILEYRLQMAIHTSTEVSEETVETTPPAKPAEASTTDSAASSS